MRVTWKEFFDNSNYDPAEYHVWSATYEGELMGIVRSWGTTVAVVMCDDGKVREVSVAKLDKIPEGAK